MRYLFDTDVCVEILRRRNPRLKQRLEATGVCARPWGVAVEDWEEETRLNMPKSPT
jgi:predicted nucleic acid-binding protein